MTRSIPRTIGLGLFAGLVAFSFAACSSNAQPTWTFGPAAAPAADANGVAQAAQSASGAAPAETTVSGAGTLATTVSHPTLNAPAVATHAATGVTTRLDLTIVTGDMIGKTEYPAYIPSDFTLPANSTVVITVTNFDDATPLPKGSEIYAKAAGIVGGAFTVTPIKVSDPNSGTAVPKTMSSLDPAQVSHTLTIPGLGINVPIAAHARETFTITTGAPGTYAWHCMDPCGAGTTGWGTAMATQKGYMEGTLTVA